MPQIRGAGIDPAAIEIGRQATLHGASATTARRILAACSDVTRVNIVRALRATPLAASDLAQVVGKTRSATSQHLRVLRELGALVAERRGTMVRYRLSESVAASVLAEVAGAFDRLAA